MNTRKKRIKKNKKTSRYDYIIDLNETFDRLDRSYDIYSRKYPFHYYIDHQTLQLEPH